jgi:hypothetical protein
MPFLPSQEFLERVREPVPPPFSNWQPWQRRLFAWGTVLVWLILVGGFAIYFYVGWQLPACEQPWSAPFNSHCHTTIGLGLCVLALVALYLLYLRFLVLVSQIAYISRNNYDVDES